ncbi:MlaC/ttg2D family ABC transporter substrate-binding protein [Minwuia sp.]|uniref:MlaC/ttg2D family ABC transporter substrate-binding protein n=1 Tax=Minwuia sp. TaxID=2493630 RepID=UPI003A8F034E
MTYFVSRHILAPMAIVLGLVASALAAEDPKQMIERLGGEAIGIAADSDAELAEKQEKFERLFQEGFDVPLVARIVLGRYWRVATPAQQEEYSSLFHRYIVATYASRLNAYSGQTFEITGDQRLNDQEVMVKSVIKEPGGPSLKVDWRVLERNGENRIVDVIVEGVSMVITHRSEFASVIGQTGNVESLLERLRAQAGQG